MTVQERRQEKAHYDRLYRRSGDHHFIGGGYRVVHENTVLSLPPAASILDIGCGSGQHTRCFARAGYRTTGVELSETAVAIARRVFADEGLTGEFRCGDIRELPFADRSFDACFMSLILHHFLDFEPVLREAARVAGQVLFVFEPNAWNPQSYLLLNLLNRVWRVPFLTPNQRAVSPRRVSAILTDCGFRQHRTVFTSLRSTAGRSLGKSLLAASQAWLPASLRHTKFIQVYERS